MDNSLLDVHEVRNALWLLLGGGLGEEGKEKWLAMRLAEGMSAEEIFADALSYINGQVAT